MRSNGVQPKEKSLDNREFCHSHRQVLVLEKGGILLSQSDQSIMCDVYAFLGKRTFQILEYGQKKALTWDSAQSLVFT